MARPHGIAIRSTNLASAVAQAERMFEIQGAGQAARFVAEQPSQAYQVEISGLGSLQLRMGDDRMSLRTRSIGRGTQKFDLGNTIPSLGQDAAGWPSLNLDRPNLSEQYVNGAKGLEHWFHIKSRPAGTGAKVWIQLALTGTSQPRVLSDRAIEVRVGKHILSYGALKVWDRDGRTLPARMVAVGHDIAISVDDQQATYPITVDPIWVQQQKLSEPSPAKDNRFGTGVAISGDTAVIGAPNRQFHRGAAYVFNRSGSVWALAQTIVPADVKAGDYFGLSTALTADTLAISSYGQNDFTGAVYVYKLANGVWTPQTEITGPAGAFGYFGYDVALSGNTLLAGSDGQASDRGFAYVYTETDGVWNLQQRLGAKDGLADDSFGWSLALSGDTALIGAQGKDGGKGAAYTFTRSGNVWKQEQKFSLLLGTTDDSFSYALGINGETAVITAFGAKGGLGQAFVYERIAGVWLLKQTLSTHDAADNLYFGYSLAANPNRIAIGSQSDSGGLVYIFDLVEGKWTEGQRLFATDASDNDYFGQSIALEGDTAIVSSIDNQAFQGAVYSFALLPTNLQLSFDPSVIVGGNSGTGKITLTAPAPAEGVTVNLNNDLAVLQLPTTVIVPAGKTSASFTYTTSPVNDDQTGTITASTPNWTSTRASFTVRAPKVIGITFEPKVVRGGIASTGTITLGKVAPAGGLTIALTSDSDSVLVPATMVVAEGSQTTTFTANTTAVTADVFAHITASSPEWASGDGVLVVEAPLKEGVRMASSAVTGGSTIVGTYNRSYEDADKAVTVLLSSNASGVTLPASITLEAGVTSKSFTVSTTPVAADKLVTIAAKHDNLSFTAEFTVRACTVESISINPGVITASQTAIGTIQLSGPAPANGVIVQIASDNKAAAFSTLTRIVIPKDGTKATFPVLTNFVPQPTDVIFTASIGTQSQSTTVKLALPTIELFVRPEVFLAGDRISVLGRLKFQFAAPKKGIRFYLSSSDPALVVPESAIIHTGANTVSFPIKHTSVRSRRVVTITATSVAGSTTGTCTLNANRIISFKITPVSVKGGNGSNVTGTVAVRFPAPEGGLVVNLLSFSRKVTIPDSLVIPKGSTSVSFNIEHSAVTQRLTVRIKATCLSSSRTAALKLLK